MTHELDLAQMAKVFYIELRGYEQPVFEMPAEALFDSEQVLTAMRTGGAMVRATGHELGVSFTGLALFNTVAAACLFYAYNRQWVDMSIGNLTFQLESHGDHVHLAFKLNELITADLSEADGERLFAELLERHIREQLAPAVRSVTESCGLKPDMVWGQYGARFAYYLNHMAENEKDSAVRARFEAATRIVMDIAPDAFARRRNPFIHKPRYIDSPYKPGATMMLRSSCCMWHCKEDGVKCYNCPKLTSEERDAMRESILAKAQ